MKIATLAYQRHENVGAQLQLWALQNKIIERGHECEVIDYICDAADRIFGPASFRVKGPKKYFTSCVGAITRIPKKSAFISFRKNQLITTKKVDKRNVKSLDGCFDGYIVGSDNVWNSCLTGLDKNYFFDFVTDKSKTASYAASLGLPAVPEDEREAFKKALAEFSFVTLRERAAAEDIAKMGIPAVESCDPTLFYTAGEWDTLAKRVKRPEHYIMVYHMSPSRSFVRFARELSRLKGLPLVYVPFPTGFCRCSMRPHIGPREWLDLIKHADYVLTDSFHGSVFSCLYGRNLFIKISQLGERLRNLTEHLGLEDRIVTTPQQAAALPDMDTKEVLSRIEDYRRAGLENLDRILENFKKDL